METAGNKQTWSTEDMKLYGIANRISGDESRENLLAWKTKLVDCFKQKKYMDKCEVPITPDSICKEWKTYAAPWFCKDAEIILRRPDIKSPGNLFDELIKRQLGDITKVSTLFLDLCRDITKPKKMDELLIAIDDFMRDFIEQRIGEKLKTSFVMPIDDFPCFADKGKNVELRRQLQLQVNAFLLTKYDIAVQIIRDTLSAEIIMGVVAAEPKLFEGWDLPTKPIDSTLYAIGDWIRQRHMTSPKRVIQLKVNPGNPLSVPSAFSLSQSTRTSPLPANSPIADQRTIAGDNNPRPGKSQRTAINQTAGQPQGPPKPKKVREVVAHPCQKCLDSGDAKRVRYANNHIEDECRADEYAQKPDPKSAPNNGGGRGGGGYPKGPHKYGKSKK